MYELIYFLNDKQITKKEFLKFFKLKDKDCWEEEEEEFIADTNIFSILYILSDGKKIFLKKVKHSKRERA